MRVSTQQVFSSGVESMQKHTQEVMEYQRQISSGKKFQRASDDALAAGLGVQVSLDKAQYAMFKVNQDHVNTSMTSSDSQLNNISGMLTRFQQLLVQAGNDALGEENRKLVGMELQRIAESVNRFANAKDANGQEIFRTVDPDNLQKVLVAPGIELETAITYTEVMGKLNNSSSAEVVSGYTDVSSVLNAIAARVAVDTDPLDADFADLSSAMTQVTRAQVKTGLLQNQLDAAVEAAETQKTNIETERSRILDTDLTEATAGLVKSNALLQAAQSVISKMDTNSLFQKL